MPQRLLRFAVAQDGVQLAAAGGSVPYGAVDQLLGTDIQTGLTAGEAAARLAQFGPNQLPTADPMLCAELLRQLFAEPMPVVVWAAILIELVEAGVRWPGEEARSSLVDVFVLLLLQFLNVFVGFFEELKARRSIDALQDSLPRAVCVRRDGELQRVAATGLVPGDIVQLEGGELVPADMRVLPGSRPFRVDASAMTGESSTVAVGPGDVVWSGTSVSAGLGWLVVTHTGQQTKMGGLTLLMQQAPEMGHFESVLQLLLIALSSVGAVVTIVVFIYLMAGPANDSFGDALGFSVVLLIASIPIALKVVCTVTLSLGAAELAADGAIVSRISSIEELAGLSVLCSDKTGTLTQGKMELRPDGSGEVCGPGFERRDALVTATLATRWTAWRADHSSQPFDPIDTMILESPAVDKRQLSAQYEHMKASDGTIEFDAFDPISRLTKAIARHKPDGRCFRVAKGACKQILDMCDDPDELKRECNLAVDALAARGIRALAVARSEDLSSAGQTTGWRLVGLLSFIDPPRPDSADVIACARKFGIEVKMITGDARAIAMETCRSLNMGDNILVGAECFGEGQLDIEGMLSDDTLGQRYGCACAGCDGFAQVVPEHKWVIVQTLRQLGHLVGMCGDGVNDAPALKRADVGIAVSGAKDAAQQAADIVLTEPGLATIVKAMVISRKIFTRMQNFVIYRVACTEQLLFFFLISSLGYNPSEYKPDGDPDDWAKFFGLPVIALVTITILNDGTIVSVAYDNAEASLKPQSWDLKLLYWISSAIGLVALISSIILLQLGLSGADGDGGLCHLGIDPLEYGEIQTMMYLKISLSDYGSVFNARTKGWFWTQRPSNIVMAAAAIAVVAATLLSAYWPFGSGMKRIQWDLIALVWAYVLVWFVVQDAAKVANYQLMQKLGFVQDLGVIDDSELPLLPEDKLSFDGQNLGRPLSLHQSLAAGMVDRSKVLLGQRSRSSTLHSMKSGNYYSVADQPDRESHRDVIL